MNEKIKRILGITVKALTWLVVAFAVCMMVFTVVTVTTVDQNDRSIFGIKFYIVQTDSMSLSEKNADLDVHFNAGDIVLIKSVEDATALQAGDVIAFMSTNSDSYGETVTHMIREVKTNDNGRVIGYVTYGTNTGANDEALVEPEYVLGRYTGKLPGVGNFFAFVKSTPGYIVCILVPFSLLILYNGINCIRLFRRYKREQMQEMQTERDKLEQERAENQRMMEELLELKAQLTKQAQQPMPNEETPVNEQSIEKTPAETPELSEQSTEETTEETSEATTDQASEEEKEK